MLVLQLKQAQRRLLVSGRLPVQDGEGCDVRSSCSSRPICVVSSRASQTMVSRAIFPRYRCFFDASVPFASVAPVVSALPCPICRATTPPRNLRRVPPELLCVNRHHSEETPDGSLLSPTPSAPRNGPARSAPIHAAFSSHRQIVRVQLEWVEWGLHAPPRMATVRPSPGTFGYCGSYLTLRAHQHPGANHAMGYEVITVLFVSDQRVRTRWV